ncbi:hypothetical protein SHIRM173S_06511 [Streptomyces hirsutus]
MTTPTGNCPAPKARCEIQSALTSRAAPMHIAGTRFGPGERVRRRASCGAVSATKPTGPEAAVAAAVSRTADSISTQPYALHPDPEGVRHVVAHLHHPEPTRGLARTSGTRRAHSASRGQTWSQSRPSREPVIQTIARAASTMSDLVSR